jgi:FKBP-type peptidyl-prolyl cis-trans isomerase
MIMTIRKSISHTPFRKNIVLCVSFVRNTFLTLGFLGLVCLFVGCLPSDPALDTSGDLIVTDVRVGNGDTVPTDPAAIAQLSITYSAKLRDSTEVATASQSIFVLVGTGEILDGLDKGLRGMRTGGTRVITVPPRFGYGNVKTGNIPANSTLIYTVNLTKVENFLKQDITVGTGDSAQSNSNVSVRYVGRLTNGTIFDATAATAQPFTFRIGSGQVIKGWEFGLLGMKIGGKRRLTIPSTMGYGANGSGASIPPNATLIFDIDLISIN